MSPQQKRLKLLLDEMFMRRSRFPVLNNLHDLKHVEHDRNPNDKKDESVVAIAKNENRILVSRNEKHMIGLCKTCGVPLICVTEAMTNEEIDSQIVSNLKRGRFTLLKLSKPVRRR
jgi:predicted nuclease of predicted toxin-antitoxin system